MKRSTLFFLLFPIAIYGQNFEQHIFSTQGDYNQSDQLSLSWTIGENFTETIYLSKQILTQGFQQPVLKISQIERPGEESLNVDLFPNPTAGSLRMKVHDVIDPLQIEIIDASGKLLSKANHNEPNGDIDLSQFPSGIYFIRITDLNTSKFSLFDIIKQ